VNAWLKHHNILDAENASFILEAPQLHKTPDVDLLLKSVKSIPAVGLIIFDTFASTFVGGDENSAKDMGLYLSNARRIQQDTGATVLIVHHSGKPSSDGKAKLERGSSALRAAVDTMIEMVTIHLKKTLRCVKQKDSEPFEPFQVRLDCFDVAAGLKPISSCVPVPIAAELLPDGSLPQLNAGQKKTFKVLVDLAFAEPGSWKKETGLAEKTFHNHRRALVSKGYVEEAEVGGKRVYQATATAKRLLSTSQGSRPIELPATATPP
jgi:hypothetical protein